MSHQKQSSLLRIFGDIHEGEAISAFLLAVNVFLILMAYYILKPIREGLMAGYSIGSIPADQLKTYLAAAMAFLLIPVVEMYSTLAAKVTRIRLIQITGALVIVCIGVFAILAQQQQEIGVVFFIWIGIVNVFLIAQFWSFASDVYDKDAGKRLFPFIAIGASAGSIAGPTIVSSIYASTTVYMLIAAGLLVASQALYVVVARRDDTKNLEEEAPLKKGGGFQMVLRDGYLLRIGLLLLVLNIINTGGEYILRNAAATYATELHPGDIPLQKIATTQFFSSFYSIVNVCSFVLQAFVVSRLFRHFGIWRVLFFLPVLSFVSSLGIAVMGSLAMIRYGKVVENSTDYSVQNTVRQALFLPTTVEAQYKAKAAIDTFFVRAGDAMAALVVFLGTQVFGMVGYQFGWFNALFSGVAILLCVGIARRYKVLANSQT